MRGKIEYFAGYFLFAFGLIHIHPGLAMVVFGLIAMFMGVERQMKKEKDSNKEGVE